MTYQPNVFTWWGEVLPCFYFPHEGSDYSERSVELPCALSFLQDVGATVNADPNHWMVSTTGGRGIEIGDRLSRYDLCGHRVVDSQSDWFGAEAIDVFDVEGTYDWIVAISSLLDVGAKDGRVTLNAVEHLRSLLAPGGRMLVTIPTGIQPFVDMRLRNGGLGEDRSCTFVRSQEDLTQWVQTETMTTLPPIHETVWASSVWVGEFSSKG